MKRKQQPHILEMIDFMQKLYVVYQGVLAKFLWDGTRYILQKEYPNDPMKNISVPLTLADVKGLYNELNEYYTELAKDLEQHDAKAVELIRKNMATGEFVFNLANKTATFKNGSVLFLTKNKNIKEEPEMSVNFKSNVTVETTKTISISIDSDDIEQILKDLIIKKHGLEGAEVNWEHTDFDVGQVFRGFNARLSVKM